MNREQIRKLAPTLNRLVPRSARDEIRQRNLSTLRGMLHPEQFREVSTLAGTLKDWDRVYDVVTIPGSVFQLLRVGSVAGFLRVEGIPIAGSR